MSKYAQQRLAECSAQVISGVDQFNDLNRSIGPIKITEAQVQEYFADHFKSVFNDKVDPTYWNRNSLTLLTSAGFMGYAAAAETWVEGEKSVTKTAARAALAVVRTLCRAGVDNVEHIEPELTLCHGITFGPVAE